MHQEVINAPQINLCVTAAFPEDNLCAGPSAECALTNHFCSYLTFHSLIETIPKVFGA